MTTTERNLGTRILRVRTPFQTIRRGWARNTRPKGLSPCLRKVPPSLRRAGLFWRCAVADHAVEQLDRSRFPALFLGSRTPKMVFGTVGTIECKWACMKTANSRGTRGCEWLRAHVIRTIGFSICIG